MMKKLFFVLMSSMVLFGCGEKRTLYIYNWEDYIDPSVIDEFSEKYNCRVVIDSFDDNEGMVAKLMAGANGYDIIFPSNYTIPTMVKNGLIKKLDSSRIPTVMRNFDPKYGRFLSETNMMWSVPYTFSITGVAYRKDKVRNPKNSWDCMLNNGGMRSSILRDMREVLGIGLLLNGHSVNSTNETELLESVRTMTEFKRKSVKIDNIQYKSGLLNGEFDMAMGYNSDILQLNEDGGGDIVGFMVPDEGSTCCFDEMVISNGSRNEDLAYLFIDFMYEKENSEKNASYVCSVVPNKMVGINAIDEDVLNRLHLIEDVGDSIVIYSKMWDMFMATTANNR